MIQPVYREGEEVKEIIRIASTVYGYLRAMSSPKLALDTVSLVSARLVIECANNKNLVALNEAVDELSNSIKLQVVQLITAPEETRQ